MQADQAVAWRGKTSTTLDWRPGWAAPCTASSRSTPPCRRSPAVPSAAALGWGAARFTEAHPAQLAGPEKVLSIAKDALMASSVVTGVANGIQGARLAKQAPDGAVPIETGTKPAAETPPKAAGIQRSLDVLGNANIASGVALIAVNAVLAQTNHSRPAKKRALTRSSGSSGSPSPLWIGSAIATAVAAVDEVRRKLS